jgi:hypothetical protein
MDDLTKGLRALGAFPIPGCWGPKHCPLKGCLTPCPGYEDCTRFRNLGRYAAHLLEEDVFEEVFR